MTLPDQIIRLPDRPAGASDDVTAIGCFKTVLVRSTERCLPKRQVLRARVTHRTWTV
jgi:hypothetical protein